mgnify:CR=1 FL=1
MAEQTTLYGPDERPLPVAMRKRAMDLAHANQQRSESYRSAGVDHASTVQWKSMAKPTSDAMRQSREVVSNRLRDLVRNNPEIAAGIEKKVNNIVGTGWRLSAKPNHRRLGITSEQADIIADQIEALWQDYAASSGFWCDAERQGDSNDLLLTAAYHMAMDDEVFGLLVWRDQPSPTGFQTAMQLIHPGRCSNPRNQSNTETLRDGITLDKFGAANGAHFRRALKGESIFKHGRTAHEWDWFPRELEGSRPRLVHCKPIREAGLKRSISKLVSVMLRARQGDQYLDYETQAAMLNAVMALFIETPFDMFDAMDSISSDSVDSLGEIHQANQAYHTAVPIKMEGAQVNMLGPGEKPHLTTPGHPNTAFEPFLQKISRTIASVLGITYEQLTMDWSEVNYSSARAAILEVARGFKVEAGQLRKQFMNLWYRAWLEEVFDKELLVLPTIDDGRELPSFDEKPDAWCGCAWIGTGKGYVDPVKEVQAAGMRIALGLSTLEVECAEQGHDWKELIEQRAKELFYMLDKGLPQSAIDSIYGASSSTTDEQSDQDNGDKDENGEELTGKQAKARRASFIPRVKRQA